MFSVQLGFWLLASVVENFLFLSLLFRLLSLRFSCLVTFGSLHFGYFVLLALNSDIYTVGRNSRMRTERIKFVIFFRFFFFFCKIPRQNYVYQQYIFHVLRLFVWCWCFIHCFSAIFEHTHFMFVSFRFGFIFGVMDILI